MAPYTEASLRDKSHGTDKPDDKRHGAASRPDIDVIDLWKSAPKAGASATDKIAPAFFTGSLRGGASDGSSPVTLKKKGPLSDDTVDKFLAQAIREKIEAQSPAGPYIKIDQPGQPLDAKRPTVAVLDDFSAVAFPLSKDAGGSTGLTHGDVTVQAAKQAGFNIIKIEGIKDFNVDLYRTDWSKPMNEIADAVHAGKLPLKPGDFVNVSLGNKVQKFQGLDIPDSGDPTFAEASKFLGMDVNAANLKDQRQPILDRLGAIAKDDTRDWMDRRVAQSALDTNRAIDRLKSMGIKVAHAAGNDGPDHFDMNFMNADPQYSEKTPSGTMSPLSADNSLATPVAVPREIRYSGVNVFDPTPIADQSGKYTLTQPIRKPDGTVEANPIASFPASEVGGALDHRLGYYFLKNHEDSYGRMGYFSSFPELDELSKTTQYGKGLIGVPHFSGSADDAQADSASGTPSYEHLSPAQKFRYKLAHPAQPSSDAQQQRFLGSKIGYGAIQLPMDGTSFGFAASAKQLYDEWQKEQGQ